jgi:hypothetical protein
MVIQELKHGKVQRKGNLKRNEGKIIIIIIIVVVNLKIVNECNYIPL